MIDLADLKSAAKARLEDAGILFSRNRYDGAAYLCGYAVEIALKYRSAISLNWSSFPETRQEFEGYQSFKSHNLDTLLRLSGREENIKSNFLTPWSIAKQWNPESRYKPPGKVTHDYAKAMIESTGEIVAQLL
jgi:HEPN domain-containing protein